MKGKFPLVFIGYCPAFFVFRLKTGIIDINSVAVNPPHHFGPFFPTQTIRNHDAHTCRATCFLPCFLAKSGNIVGIFDKIKKNGFCRKRWKSCYDWSRWADSNRRPTDYESVALPAELHRLALKRCRIYMKGFALSTSICAHAPMRLNH